MPDPIDIPHDPETNLTGAIHHIELWVPDFGRATAAWEWLLAALGYTPFQAFRNGVSWRHEETGTYIVIEQSPDMLAIPHDRHRPGLNHLAFRGGSREHVEHLTQHAQEHGWTLRERIAPSAGEAGYYATYLTDADGFEVELVARDA
ncbi:MAG: VOC family protein [Thermomicrobiales bacterium]